MQCYSNRENHRHDKLLRLHVTSVFQCPLIRFGTRQRLLFITKRRNDCSTLLPPYSGRLSRRTDMSYYVDPALTTKVSHRFYGLKGVGLLAHIQVFVGKFVGHNSQSQLAPYVVEPSFGNI